MKRESTTRVIKFPVHMYDTMRDLAEKEGRTNREILADAIGENLREIETLLREAGFAPNEGKLKPIRCALDDQNNEDLREIKDELGTDVTMLVLLCLRRHLWDKGLHPEDRQSKK